MSTERHDYTQQPISHAHASMDRNGRITLHPDPYSVRLHGVPDEPQEPASVECVKEHLAAMMRASYGERAPLIVGWGHLIRRDTYSHMVEDCQALVAKAVKRIRSSTPTCPSCDAFPLLCPFHGAENAREPVAAASEPAPVPVGTRVRASNVCGLPREPSFIGTIEAYSNVSGTYYVGRAHGGLWVNTVEPLDDEPDRRAEHNARMIQAGAASPAEVRRQMLGPLKLPANDGPPPGYEFKRGRDMVYVLFIGPGRPRCEWRGAAVFGDVEPSIRSWISKPEHRPALEWAKRMLGGP